MVAAMQAKNGVPMDANALARLKRLAGKQTVVLTHYGRKSGKAARAAGYKNPGKAECVRMCKSYASAVARPRVQNRGDVLLCRQRHVSRFMLRQAAPSTASNIRRQRAQHVVSPTSADGARASPDAQWREA